VFWGVKSLYGNLNVLKIPQKPLKNANFSPKLPHQKQQKYQKCVFAQGKTPKSALFYWVKHQKCVFSLG